MRSKRRKNLSIITLFLALALLGINLITFVATSNFELRINNYEEETQNYKLQIAQIIKKYEEINQNKYKSLRMLQQLVPANMRYKELFVYDIDRILAEENIGVDYISINEVDAFDPLRFDESKFNGFEFKMLEFSMNLYSDNEDDIFEFIKKIQDLDRAILINGLRLTMQNEAIIVNLTFETFYLESEIYPNQLNELNPGSNSYYDSFFE